MCVTRTRFDIETNLRNQNPEELKLQVKPTSKNIRFKVDIDKSTKPSPQDKFLI
jgi:hypothetical protein